MAKKTVVKKITSKTKPAQKSSAKKQIRKKPATATPKKKPAASKPTSKAVECEIVEPLKATGDSESSGISGRSSAGKTSALKATEPLATRKATRVEILEPKGRSSRKLEDEGSDHGDDISGDTIEPIAIEPEILEPAVDTDWDPEQDFAEIKDLKPKKKILKKTKTVNALVPVGSKALSTSVDPISAYLAEIRKYPLLTKEQEVELAKHYFETKDPAAAQALVTANLRFVVKVAAEYSKYGARLIDLVQEGNMGLMHAVREFNPYKGVRLITYAVWWIRGYIQEYLLKQYSMVKIATTQNQKRLFYRLQKEKDLLDAMGEAPDMKLIGERMGIPTEEVEQMANRLSGRDVSLNTPLDDGSTTSLIDMQKSTESGVDDQIAAQEEISLLREKLEELRDDLSEREKIILEERLLADEPLTLQEIGEKHGITREAVRQMEARLMKKIRDRYLASLTTTGEDE